MEALAVTAIITSIGTLIIICGKTIKKSSCCGSNCETRTPPPSVVIEPPLTQPVSRQPSPQPQHRYLHDANLKSSDDFLPQKKSSTFYSEINV